MEFVNISGTTRTDFGKKQSKADRANGHIPCVIYSGVNAVHFTTQPLVVRDLVFTPAFKLAHITVEGKEYKCFVKQVSFHPVTDNILTIEFQELIPGRRLIVDIPVVTVGSSPGVKAGGKLLQSVRRVRIKCYPEDLVTEMTLDISSLELGQAIRVRDIKAESGIEIVNPAGTPVALIEIPRALRSAAAKQGK
jgi:large subunit ribosomal protein L25